MRAAIRHFSVRAISLGGLSWRELAVQFWRRLDRDDVFGRAAELSYYFLLALFPLLIFLSALLGRVFSKEGDLYWRLLSHFHAVMPPAAFELLRGTFQEITHSDAGGKLTFGLLLSVWTASSGMAAIIEGLNFAYEVKESRAWWRRRVVAILLTIIVGLMVTLALFLILAGDAVATSMSGHFPILEKLSQLSSVTQWSVGVAFLLLALSMIYYFAPSVHEPRLEGNLPGAILSVLCWIAASAGFRLYLLIFGSFDRTYGSLGAVIVLLTWLYVSGAAVLIGGELNSVILKAVSMRKAE